MTSQHPAQEAATELLAEQMNRLRGRLLGMVEAVGFPARQEAGIKSLLKSLTYDAQAELAKTIADLYAPLYDEYRELRLRMDGLEK